MTNTLVIVAHPDLSSSRANAALLAALEPSDSVAVRLLTATEPLDIPAEQRALEAADEIVLQYPTYWYSPPATLKNWLDEVLVRGWAYGTGAPGALAGKGLRVVTTTGGAADAYRPDGFHGWHFDDVLIPMKALARRLGMAWREPLAVHGVRELDAASLAELGLRYRALIAAPAA